MPGVSPAALPMERLMALPVLVRGRALPPEPLPEPLPEPFPELPLAQPTAKPTAQPLSPQQRPLPQPPSSPPAPCRMRPASTSPRRSRWAT